MCECLGLLYIQNAHELSEKFLSRFPKKKALEPDSSTFYSGLIFGSSNDWGSLIFGAWSVGWSWSSAVYEVWGDFALCSDFGIAWLCGTTVRGHWSMKPVFSGSFFVQWWKSAEFSSAGIMCWCVRVCMVWKKKIGVGIWDGSNPTFTQDTVSQVNHFWINDVTERLPQITVCTNSPVIVRLAFILIFRNQSDETISPDFQLLNIIFSVCLAACLTVSAHMFLLFNWFLGVYSLQVFLFVCSFNLPLLIRFYCN